MPICREPGCIHPVNVKDRILYFIPFMNDNFFLEVLAQWTSRSNKKKAKKLFAGALDRLDQDAVDVCEVVFDLTSKLSLEDGDDGDCESGKHSTPSSSRKDHCDIEMASVEYFVEATGEIISVPQGNSQIKRSKERRKERRRKAREGLRNGVECAELLSDDYCESTSEEEDERIQMREDERFSQPPLLRIMDSKNNLHVVTICGGVVGRQSGCDIVVDDPSISRRLLEFVFVPESNSFVVNKLSDKGHVVLNDYELLLASGNNTCPGCEQGLFTPETTTVSQSVTVPYGETARRRNMKALKAMYGINDYAENARTPFYGPDRAAKRRRLVGSEIDVNKDGSIADPNNIYAGCAAKPVPGVAVVSKFDPVKPLNEANKGFRLLQSMGWKEGEGLGKDGSGRQQPIESTVRNERSGLGATESKPAPPKSRKDVILDKTRERYEKLLNSTVEVKFDGDGA
ncbi:g-patch domain protein [Teladorsagia circumcincta]|uniref:G-patch domain protein n=1 Tax=Teladorsagia circumcincta TaxID=45464 RepID=A0A2G9UF16_TELCI|nr:g-patch domain protein [Teladorsagia circumcincta]